MASTDGRRRRARAQPAKRNAKGVTRSENGINICDCYIDEEDSDFEGCQGECLDNDPFEKQLWDMPGLVAITLTGYVAEQNKWKESIESHNKWIIRLKNEINKHNFAITQILKEKNT